MNDLEELWLELTLEKDEQEDAPISTDEESKEHINL